MSKMHRADVRVKTTHNILGKVQAFLATPWLLAGVSWGAIALSCALAAVGVAGLVGFGSWLARLGTAILIVGTLLTEVAASRLPLHAEKLRFTDPNGERVELQASLPKDFRATVNMLGRHGK